MSGFCSTCGAAIPTGAFRCATCGVDLHSEPTLRESTGLAEPPPVAGDMIRASLERATQGRYRIVDVLGRGGMGAVYRARDLVLGHEVALKVMLPDATDSHAVLRFRQEAQTIASLRHPHIVAVHDLKEHEGLHYFVLSYIDGRSLQQIVRTAGPLPAPVITLWLGQIAGALAYAHDRGVIHRDIKPANVLIDTDGHAILSDFGIAKLERQREWKTATGLAPGTPAYASPEQCMGEAVTPASDQYSLGVVAYEMVSGQPPFSGDSGFTLCTKHLEQEPAPLRSHRPDCPDTLAQLVHRMLEKQPARRCVGMREVVQGLGPAPPPGTPPWHEAAALSGGQTVHMGASPSSWVTPVPPPPEPHRRSRKRGVALGGAVAVVAALLWIGWPRGDPAAAVLALAATDTLLVVGDSTVLQARRAGGAAGAADSVEWRSSDPAVASVAAGTVRAHRPGAAEITARYRDEAAAVRLHVVEAAPGPPGPGPAPAAGRVALRLPAARLRVGDSVRPEVAIVDDAGNPLAAVPAVLSAAEPTVVHVTASGWIVGVGPGSTRVTARAQGQEAYQGLTVEAAVPVFRSLSAGVEHTCGISSGGIRYCWGNNERGQAAPGLGGVLPAPFPLPGAFEAIAAGGDHSCALRGNGQVLCWGALGSPRGAFRVVTAGTHYACALAAGGVTQCWGANDRGQLGDGSTAARAANAAVQGDVAFEMLASGADHSCGLLGGRVYCWGGNDAGESGTGAAGRTAITQPTEVAGDHDHFTFVTAGAHHTCTLTRVGWAFCWGSNEQGQLGDGSRQSRSAPRPVRPAMGLGQMSYAMLSAGGAHTCGITPSNRLFCWGDNAHGQLGDGTTESRVVPTRAGGDAEYAEVSAGRSHTCARTASGEARCWGRGAGGAAGVVPGR